MSGQLASERPMSAAVWIALVNRARCQMSVEELLALARDEGGQIADPRVELGRNLAAMTEDNLLEYAAEVGRMRREAHEAEVNRINALGRGTPDVH